MDIEIGQAVRQGDVMLERLLELPAGLVAAKADGERYVLEYGEVTGHAHAVLERDAVVYGSTASGQVVAVHSSTPLVHEEHGQHALPVGVFDRWIQSEYDGEDERRVSD